jgi:two-component system response regulator
MMSEAERDVEILLIEDNVEDAELTMRVFKEKNLANRLVWVKNGALGLDFLFGRGPYAGRDSAQMPRLVLLDLHLPKVGGLEVLRELKSNPRTRSIPIVVLSSSTQDKDILQSYDLGVNSYVSKPIKFEDFVNVVAHLGLYWLVINKSPVAS